jgi:SAM-dependent methyltransferase
MSTSTTGEEFFEEKYVADRDPWKFASSDYELGRYQAIMTSLSGRRYRRAFEPGCSVGVLTSRLATICDHVEAIDISPTAAERARERCRELSNVNINCGALGGTIPNRLFDLPFDLIVLSEIGYYFTEEELSALTEKLKHSLSPSGVLLAAHWLGTSEDHILNGNMVHGILATISGLAHNYSERHPDFRIDRWIRT